MSLVINRLVRPLAKGVALAVLGTALHSALPVPVASQLTLISAAQAEEEKKRETRRTPALREATYKRLAEAQELVDLKDYAGADQVLVELLERRGLNAYEIASAYNMRAFVSFSNEDYPGAIAAYEGVLSQSPEIPEALEQSALYSLGQLYFVQENYVKAIDYLNRWFGVTENPGPQPYMFLAQAYYQLEDYKRVPEIVQQAMDVAVAREQEIKENWWLLSRAAYYELEDWNNVVRILEILVRDFPKKEYWIQLSGLYGQQEKGKAQIATIWTAYLQGLLDQEREILNVSGLLLQEEVPYFAAMILSESMDKEIVERNPKNLQMLGQAYQLAQEADKAIPVYKEAAQKSDEGELFYRLAQLYLDKDQCKNAVEASDSAMEKGGIDDRLADLQLVKGMCQFELKEYAAAIESFNRGIRATEDESDLRSLRQWKRYVEGEKARDDELKRAAARG
jgi:tetratricopeptide (TPR) repeat protein